MVEIYGQNEIYELAKSDGMLTGVLDRFMPESADQQSQLNSAYRKLRENSERLVKAEEQRNEIETQIAQLPKLEEQVSQFKDQRLEEKLKQVPQFEKERQLIQRILEELRRTGDGQQRFVEFLPDFVFLSDRVLEDLPHAELLQRGRRVLENVRAILRRKAREVEIALANAEAELTQIVGKLNKELQVSEAQLDEDFAKLPAVAGQGSKEIGCAYQQLLREIERLRSAQTRLDTVDSLVKEVEQTRRNLLGEMADIRSRRTATKQKTAKDLNRCPAGKLRITLIPDGSHQPPQEFLQELRGVGVQKTKWVVSAQELMVMKLVAGIREREDGLLGKGWGLPPGMAETLVRLTPAQIHAMESIDIEGRVSLELNVSHKREQYRPLDRLSTGQQCTTVLHLLVLDNQYPLIMDQTGDNLDNAFIAEHIVQELLIARTERQFLFATHNANIPIFGDTAWIGVCAAAEDRAETSVDAQGSDRHPSDSRSRSENPRGRQGRLHAA